MSSASEHQKTVCSRHGVLPEPPGGDEKVGIALGTLGRVPLNGLRHASEGDTCGWYIWAGEGEPSDADDFFQPLHVHHLWERCPEVLPYLALPPGWRFLIAPGYEDVWYDPALLER
jgi:hypothetical protein